MRPALAVLLAALATPTLAADQWPHQAECRRWAAVAIPAQDIGTAREGCNTTDLYYGDDGNGRGRDYVAARHCAYRTRAAGAAAHDGPMFDGNGVLMMLYANGQGVRRNLPLAKRFACEFDGAPAEVSARLAHLDAIASGKASAPMDICDDITSGMMGGFCEYRSASFARVRRGEQWQALQASWTPAQRAAFAKLRKAADAYFDSASANEVDLSGTLRGAFATQAWETLDVALLSNIQRFEQRRRPDGKAGDLAAADKALNASYQRVRARLTAASGDGGLGEYGTIDANGVRQTQRLWLAYRDAWVAFAGARYPDTAADSWLAWVSRERSKALDAIIDPD